MRYYNWVQSENGKIVKVKSECTMTQYHYNRIQAEMCGHHSNSVKTSNSMVEFITVDSLIHAFEVVL